MDQKQQRFQFVFLVLRTETAKWNISKMFSSNYPSRHQMLTCYSSCCQQSKVEFVGTAKSFLYIHRINFPVYEQRRKALGFTENNIRSHMPKNWQNIMASAFISCTIISVAKRNRKSGDNSDKQQPRWGKQDNFAMKFKCSYSLKSTFFLSLTFP